MTREFLKNLGVEDTTIDKILDENMQDIGKEKRKTDAAEARLTTAKADLETANGKLDTANKELDTLKKANGDIAAVQQQFSELQSKYDTDTAALKGQLADRDYSDALERGIKNKVPDGFTSKSGRESLVARAKEKNLELKDGELIGLDDVIKSHKEEDPGAYATSKPAPSFGTRPVGGSGTLGQPSRAAIIAAQYNQSLYGVPKKE